MHLVDESSIIYKERKEKHFPCFLCWYYCLNQLKTATPSGIKKRECVRACERACCAFISTVNSYGHVGTARRNHSFVGRLRPPKRLTRTMGHSFASSWQLLFLNQWMASRRSTAIRVTTDRWHTRNVRQATNSLFSSRGEYHAGQNTADTQINAAKEPWNTKRLPI